MARMLRKETIKFLISLALASLLFSTMGIALAVTLDDKFDFRSANQAQLQAMQGLLTQIQTELLKLNQTVSAQGTQIALREVDKEAAKRKVVELATSVTKLANALKAAGAAAGLMAQASDSASLDQLTKESSALNEAALAAKAAAQTALDIASSDKLPDSYKDPANKIKELLEGVKGIFFDDDGISTLIQEKLKAIEEFKKKFEAADAGTGASEQAVVTTGGLPPPPPPTTQEEKPGFFNNLLTKTANLIRTGNFEGREPGEDLPDFTITVVAEKDEELPLLDAVDEPNHAVTVTNIGPSSAEVGCEVFENDELRGDPSRFLLEPDESVDIDVALQNYPDSNVALSCADDDGNEFYADTDSGTLTVGGLRGEGFTYHDYGSFDLSESGSIGGLGGGGGRGGIGDLGGTFGGGKGGFSGRGGSPDDVEGTVPQAATGRGLPSMVSAPAPLQGGGSAIQRFSDSVLGGGSRGGFSSGGASGRGATGGRGY